MKRFVLLWFVSISTLAAADDPIQSGPMLGYADKREVLIWVQTKTSASVQIRYTESGKSKPVTTIPIQTLAERDFIAHVVIGQLSPGTAYSYDVLINGKAVRQSLTFKTQVLWEWRTDPPDFTAMIGSCAYINEPEFDRPEEPYGSDFHIFETMAKVKPDLMIWMGDNVYLREVDWNTRSGMLYRYRHTRSYPGLQPILSMCPQYATWDDHDYGPNDSDRGFMQKFTSLEVFKLYWGNPAYGFPNVPGVFFQFAWNDIDFFMLDDRFYRAPQRMKDGPDKAFLGKEQLLWLKDGLMTSRAPFKVIVCGSQVVNQNTDHESYNLHKFEREDLLTFIRDNNIPGVFFISGDVHHSVMIKQDNPDFYPFYDYSSSSITAGLFRNAKKLINPMIVDSSLVSDDHNFGLLKFSGPRKNRTLTIETVNADGKVMWRFQINQNDLMPKVKEQTKNH